MKSRRTLSITLGVGAVCVVSALWIRFAFSSDEPNDESNAASATVYVQQLPLRQGTLPVTVTAYGVVQADASARNTIMAPVAARVGAVYVHLGQEVANDAPLLQLVPTPPTASAYAQAVSAFKAATAAAQRTQQLLDEHLATRQQLADDQKAESDARAALTALQTQGAGGPTTLRAPFHAIVTALPINTNALVTEGTPLLDLAPPGNLVLQVGVVPAQAVAIRTGNAADVTPVGTNQSHAGRVALRGSIVDASTGLVPVQISLPGADFFPGETAQAAITTGTVSGYVVPHAAILVDDSGDTYVVQTEKMVAKTVHVRVLAAHGDEDAIEGPLDATAPVVLSGNHQLQDGMKVRLTEAPDSGKSGEADKSEGKTEGKGEGKSSESGKSSAEGNH
jgi:membrane fusion protein (multidrug efflux system)